MYCLTVYQPYASRIIAGEKTREQRTWPTRYRGRLYIHAAAEPYGDHPVRVVLGHVTLTGVTFDAGEYHWHLADPVPIPHVPLTGTQGLYPVHVCADGSIRRGPSCGDAH